MFDRQYCLKRWKRRNLAGVFCDRTHCTQGGLQRLREQATEVQIELNHRGTRCLEHQINLDVNASSILSLKHTCIMSQRNYVCPHVHIGAMSLIFSVRTLD
jgi:hypothetical protein